MTRPSSDIAFTPAVKAIQSQKGSRASYARMEQRGGWQTGVTEDLAGFVAGLDMFYLGTANKEGQPYIQYRGGPVGFLKVVDEHTLGFADFGGNRQYITLGNLSENPKAFLFLMDYVNQQRIKLWGQAEVVEGNAELNERLSDASYSAKVERSIFSGSRRGTSIVLSTFIVDFQQPPLNRSLSQCEKRLSDSRASSRH